MYFQQHKPAVMLSSAAVLLMALGNSANAAPTCQYTVDPDGNGWGYENSAGQNYEGGSNTGFFSCVMPIQTPPTFNITTPTEVPAGDVTFSGTAQDESGILNVRVFLQNSSNQRYDFTSGQFSSSVVYSDTVKTVDLTNNTGTTADWSFAASDLAPGDYKLRLRVWDKSDPTQATGWTTNNFTVLSGGAVDTQPPIYNIESPVGEVTAGDVTFSGSAQDETGVRLIRALVLNESGQRYDFTSGQFNDSLVYADTVKFMDPPDATATDVDWSFVANDLVPGNYRLRLKFWDNKSPAQSTNWSTENFTVLSDGAVDTLPPTFNIVAPIGEVTAGDVTFSGNAQDETGVRLIRALVLNESGQRYDFTSGQFNDSLVYADTVKFMDPPDATATDVNWSFVANDLVPGNYRLRLKFWDNKSPAQSTNWSTENFTVTPSVDNPELCGDRLFCALNNDPNNGDIVLDTSGIGYAWNDTDGVGCIIDGTTAQTQQCPDSEPPESTNTTKTPSPTKPFSKFEVDKSMFTNNVYDGRQHVQIDELVNGVMRPVTYLTSYNNVRDSVEWSVAHNESTPCSSTSLTGPVKLKYRLTAGKDASDKNSWVRSFPAMVVGSMGGRYESTGVECGGTVPQLSSTGRVNSPVFDMNVVNLDVDFPIKAQNIKETKISVKGDINKEDNGTAAKGIANVFLDSYWHDVSNQNWVPNKLQSYVGTLNGINSDATEVWNLNLWLDKSSTVNIAGRSDNGWTGGRLIAGGVNAGGFTFDVYFKKEGSGTCTFENRGSVNSPGNCFLYVGLVASDQNLVINGATIDYKQLATWFRSSAFRDLLTGWESEPDDIIKANRQYAYNLWKGIDGTSNDAQPVPGPRFPDGQHVIGGMHLGSELWYNPSAEASVITFEKLGIEVDDVEYGRF